MLGDVAADCEAKRNKTSTRRMDPCQQQLCITDLGMKLERTAIS